MTDRAKHAITQVTTYESVHRGSVAADIEVISSYDGTKRAELWKQAFERSYGVSFEKLKLHWLHVSDKFLFILNRRASVDRLAYWGRPHHINRATRIIRLADDRAEILSFGQLRDY